MVVPVSPDFEGFPRRSSAVSNAAVGSSLAASRRLAPIFACPIQQVYKVGPPRSSCSPMSQRSEAHLGVQTTTQDCKGAAARHLDLHASTTLSSPESADSTCRQHGHCLGCRGHDRRGGTYRENIPLS